MANSGYKIQPRLKKVSNDVNEFPMDVNNELCSVSGLPQATMNNPTGSSTYRVLSDDCPFGETTYFSVEKSGTATKNDCESGETGSLETYIVTAGTYTSIVSQVDADNQAQADVDANKQSYANTVGTCTSTGEDYYLKLEDVSTGGTGHNLIVRLTDVADVLKTVSVNITFDWGATSTPVGGGGSSGVGSTGVVLNSGTSSLVVFTYDSASETISDLVIANPSPSTADGHLIIV